ncbi:hypothetical protein EAH87_00785 [Sphingomonas koreensis]|nr:hypothetical protein EAH87_00785 [Sphingomonas koreensis]
MEDRSGVERLRARERRRWMIVAGAVLLIVVDLIFMWTTGNLPRDLGHLPPDLANGLATGMLTGAAICLFRILRTECDEHEIRARMFGAQMAFTTFAIAYPVWALFAIGGVLPPVNGFVLWAGAIVLYLGGFLWRKYR